MKRTIALMLAFCLAVCLCACGNKTDNSAQAYDPDAYVKVFLGDGSTETFDLATLPEMAENDTETYNTKYAGNKIEMATTVTKVELDYEMLGFVRVSFEGGWICYIRKGTPVIDEIKRGMAVDVTATLIMDATNLVGTTLYGATITVK